MLSAHAGDRPTAAAVTTAPVAVPAAVAPALPATVAVTPVMAQPPVPNVPVSVAVAASPPPSVPTALPAVVLPALPTAAIAAPAASSTPVAPAAAGPVPAPSTASGAAAAPGPKPLASVLPAGLAAIIAAPVAASPPPPSAEVVAAYAVAATPQTVLNPYDITVASPPPEAPAVMDDAAPAPFAVPIVPEFPAPTVTPVLGVEPSGPTYLGESAVNAGGGIYPTVPSATSLATASPDFSYVVRRDSIIKTHRACSSCPHCPTPRALVKANPTPSPLQQPPPPQLHHAGAALVFFAACIGSMVWFCITRQALSVFLQSQDAARALL